MPRQSRIETSGALHNIMARGIEGGKIFSPSGSDQANLLEPKNIC